MSNSNAMEKHLNPKRWTFEPQKMNLWTPTHEHFNVFKALSKSKASKISHSSGHSMEQKRELNEFAGSAGAQGEKAWPDLPFPAPNSPSPIPLGIPGGSWSSWVSSAQNPAPKSHEKEPDPHGRHKLLPELELQSQKSVYFFHELLGFSTGGRENPSGSRRMENLGFFPSVVLLSWHVVPGLGICWDFFSSWVMQRWLLAGIKPPAPPISPSWPGFPSQKRQKIKINHQNAGMVWVERSWNLIPGQGQFPRPSPAWPWTPFTLFFLVFCLFLVLLTFVK